MKRTKQGFRLCAICLAAACILMGCNRNQDSSKPQQSIESSIITSETTATTTTATTTKPVVTTTTTTTAAATSATTITTTTVVTTEAVTTTTAASTTANQTASTTHATALTTTTSSSDSGNAQKYVGVWNCTVVVLDGVTYSVADLEAQLGMALFFQITVSAEGTLFVRSSASAEPMTGIWSEQNGDAVFTVDGQSIAASVVNEQLVLNDLTNQLYFVKET